MAEVTNTELLEFYRCPEEFAQFSLPKLLSGKVGYFRFSKNTICFGQTSCSSLAPLPTDLLHDALTDVSFDGGTPCLPFDPSGVIGNLRFERYLRRDGHPYGRILKSAVERAYYLVRPLLPLALRVNLQRSYLSLRRGIAFPQWPVDCTVENIFENLLALSLRAKGIERLPFVWFWPNSASACAIMTHDVETAQGRDFCWALMDLDSSFQIKSSFQLVPEKRYQVSRSLLETIKERGFEVNVHDLDHTGHMFSTRLEFLRRIRKINHYGREFGAAGFRTGLMYRNLDWWDALEFSYDMSVPNVAHLDPQQGGCCTVMPYFVGNILELPLTTTQDYALFHFLGDYSIELWKKQIALIMEKHGLISFDVHPDYIIDERARNAYVALLAHLSRLRSGKMIWITVPKEVDRWWRQRSQMKLVGQEGHWCIEGSGAERARIAYASLQGGRVVYSLE